MIWNIDIMQQLWITLIHYIYPSIMTEAYVSATVGMSATVGEMSATVGEMSVTVGKLNMV